MYPATVLKMFQSQEYANNFMSGKLFANTLSYYKQEEKQRNQFDPHEGTYRYPVNDAILTFTTKQETFNITPDNGLLSFSMMPNFIARVNVFCMYTLRVHPDELPNPNDLPDSLTEYTHHFSIDPICQKDFGEHLVVVTNPKAFSNRLENTLSKMLDRREIRRYQAKEVTYSEFNIPSDYAASSTYSIEPAFTKRPKFAHEKETRIVIDFNDNHNKSRVIDIGNISDITQYVKTSEFVSKAVIPIQRD